MLNKGKISDEELVKIKASIHQGEKLFKWFSPDKKDEAIIRAISVELFKKMRSFIKEAEDSGKPLPIEEVNERIFDSCVLWPKLSLEEKLNLPVGVIPSLVKVIQEKSGFLDIDIHQRILGPDVMSSTVRDYEYWGEPSSEELEDLKKKSPFYLSKTWIGKWCFVIRPMTRTDIRIANQANDDQLALAKAVVMWPKEINWDVIPAGTIEILGRVTHGISGWTDESTCEEI